MKLERYKPNRRGVKDLLKKPEVLGHLIGRAERVADVVRADYQERPPHSGQIEVVVAASMRDERARAAVIAKHPAALPIEADRRPLGSALDAAGG